MEIIAYNCDPGKTVVDFYDGSESLTADGIAYLANGMPVSKARAMREGFKFDPSFKGPTFRNRGEVTTWLADILKVPHGTALYNRLYAELAGRLPEMSGDDLDKLRPHSWD